MAGSFAPAPVTIQSNPPSALAGVVGWLSSNGLIRCLEFKPTLTKHIYTLAILTDEKEDKSKSDRSIDKACQLIEPTGCEKLILFKRQNEKESVPEMAMRVARLLYAEGAYGDFPNEVTTLHFQRLGIISRETPVSQRKAVAIV